MRNPHTGFTLVELLVVVTMIVILLAVMMPAVDRAVAAGERAGCGANLHAIGQATYLYRTDHKRTFPSGATAVGLSYGQWGGKLGAEFKSPVRMINRYAGINSTAELDSNSGAFRVFLCPADNGADLVSRDGERGFWAPRKPTIFDALGASYFYNSTANTNEPASPDGLWRKRSLRNPEANVVYASDYPFNAYFIYQANSVVFQYSYWHDEKEHGWGNVAFADFHVEYLQAVVTEKAGGGHDHQNGPGYTFKTNP